MISGWISVKERLPVSDQPVLVFGTGIDTFRSDPQPHMAVSKYGAAKVDCGNLLGAWMLPYGAGFGVVMVTHWMPLPEPPKGP